MVCHVFCLLDGSTRRKIPKQLGVLSKPNRGWKKTEVFHIFFSPQPTMWSSGENRRGTSHSLLTMTDECGSKYMGYLLSLLTTPHRSPCLLSLENFSATSVMWCNWKTNHLKDQNPDPNLESRSSQLCSSCSWETVIGWAQEWARDHVWLTKALPWNYFFQFQDGRDKFERSIILESRRNSIGGRK